MKANYLTIEREYGSGGTEIARRLSEQTGIACYGRELLEAAAKELDLTVSAIERYEETVTNSFLYSAYVLAQTANGNADLLSREGHIFLTEQAVIRRFAQFGHAIFLGHCASEALKQRKDVVSVFIRCGDEEKKQQRIISEYGIDASDAERLQKQFDRKRSNYYYANTLKKWEDLRQYDIVLDSATLGFDGCVALLSGILS